MKSNRLQLHTPSSSSTLDWSKYKTKQYLHFDVPLNIKRVKNLIRDPKKIKSHAFLPFINFDITFKKYVLKKPENITNKDYLPKHFKEKQEKTRSIMYASHVDQFIYKYYGDLLNDAYNEYVKNTSLDNAVLAYRNNKKGKSSIDFSAEVFQYIVTQQEALIISLDFSGFFDNITHKKLKDSIKKVLDTESITSDIYQIYKNTTKYSYISKEKIDEF